MIFCNFCGSVMQQGTHYETGKHNRFMKCPKCHLRIDGRKEMEFYQYSYQEDNQYQKNIRKVMK